MATGTSPTNSANTFASLLGPGTTLGGGTGTGATTLNGQTGQASQLTDALGTISGGTLSNLLTSIYGQKYGIPNPTSTAATATVGNTEDLGNIANLTEGADTISAAGAALPFDMNLPGYQQNLEQAATNTGQELQGQLPQDVQNLLGQQAAERGVSTGQGAGSPNTNADYLQALGLTSMGQQQTGMGNLSSLIGETPTGAGFNPSSMFVTPTQQQAAQLASNQEAAAPDPATSGFVNTLFGFI